jgi:hypothetical protein
METLNEKLVDAYAEVMADANITGGDVMRDLKKSHRLIREMMNWLEMASHKLNEMDSNGLLSIREVCRNIEELARSMKIK